MARSCGIRIGPRRVELVVLDGSPRKHKIAAFMADEYCLDGDDPTEAMIGLTEILREAVKTHRIPKENVGIAIDTGLAAFRTLRLPFRERAKIEQVLKFEVESQLPQWNIDDVVVDFFVLDEGDDQTKLLTTGVRKSDLNPLLHACERAGIDPLEAELETSAMVNAAAQAGHYSEESAQVFVHIGEHSTSLVVMDGGRLREMRAIHIGALTHEIPVLPTEGGGEEGENGGAAPEVEAPDPIEVQRRVDQAVKRIRREIGRSVSAARTTHEIEAIFICGLELPGLIGSPIQDLPVYELDVFEEDSGQPAEGIGELVVPYGVALKRLGGGLLSGSLRREELRYTGTFEKLELPLAVVCLLLATLLGVHTIFVFKQYQSVNGAFAYWRDSSNNLMIGDGRKGYPGRLEYPSDTVKNYVASLQRKKVGEREIPSDDKNRNRYEQLTWIRELLTKEVQELQKQLGTSKDIVQPQSAFKAATLVLGLMKDAGDQIGRPSIRMLRSDFEPGRQSRPDSCRVIMDITFFADNVVDASNHLDTFVRLLKAKPWCLEVELKRVEDIADGGGIKMQGFPITVDVTKAKAQS